MVTVWCVVLVFTIFTVYWIYHCSHRLSVCCMCHWVLCCSGGGCSSSAYGFQSHNMGAGTYSQPTGTGTAGSGGGFWSGAATGGILGYLLGSSSSRQRYYQPYPDPTRGWGSSGFGSSSPWGSSTWSGSSDTFGGGSSSSGTRTASGN